MDVRFNNKSSDAYPISIPLKNPNTSIQIGGDVSEVIHNVDLALRLDSSSFTSVKGVKWKRDLIDRPANQQVDALLGLQLGDSSSLLDGKGSKATTCTSMYSSRGSDKESLMDLDLDFILHPSGEMLSGIENSGISNFNNVLPNVDLQLSLSSGSAVSDVTNHPCSAPMEFTKIITGNGTLNPDDESPGISLSLSQPLGRTMQRVVSPDLSSSTTAAPKSTDTCTSGIIQSQQHRSSSTKQCQFQGCLKGARGASGRCIAHGGGRRCQRPACHKGAEGRTAFCKAHGGGRRCEFLGCTKSAEGRTDFCIAHGGGRRCSHDSCTRAARGKSGLCIRHGGGKRCQRENCTKSAEGLSGLCISHGGGRRCQYRDCGKGAQGSTMFCKAHGGGKRCTYVGCNKGAEGSSSLCKGHGGGKRCSFQGGGVCPKSVHGGTLFCVAHGGGKRCAITECTRSARGRTDFCVRHGGGKRCKIEGCGKSAQGSTNFCKAHGGGKKCSWGLPDCEFGSGNDSCSSLTRGKTILCASHSALVQDQRVHGGATIGTVVHNPKASYQATNRKHICTSDDATDFMITKKSIVTSADSWNYFGMARAPPAFTSNQSSSSVQEGRVHGGNLMAVYTGNLGFNCTGYRGMADS